MADVFQFRIARAPQRVVVPTNAQLTLTYSSTLEEWLTQSEFPNVGDYLAQHDLLPPTRKFHHSDPIIRNALEQIRWLDDFLTTHNNQIDWRIINNQAIKKLDGKLSGIIARWMPLREALSLAIVAVTIYRVTPSLRSDILRLLLVIGLIELAAENENLGVEVNENLDAKAVFAALRWRTVLLPSKLLDFSGIQHSLLARRPGRSDLYVVREEWDRYELGEIAHIENVLKGELKERLLERTDEQEITTTTDKEVNRTEERDSQTTDRFELKQETSKDTSLAFHIDGKVETSGQYGPTHVDTSIGGSFDYSVNEAEKRATMQARETISRAVSKIEERVREQRVARTLTRISSTDKHVLNNEEGKDNVSGIYRWVDKIKIVQIFKYPHRMLFEFQVPEPAAMIRYQLSKMTVNAPAIPPLTLDGKEEGKKLTPDFITSEATGGDKINYLELAQRYAVEGIVGPPSGGMVFEKVTVPSAETDMKNANKPPQYDSTTFITVPEGYEATDFTVFAWGTNAVPKEKNGTYKSTGWIEVLVGTDPMYDTNNGNIWRFSDPDDFGSNKTAPFSSPVSGKVPIQIRTDDTYGLGAAVKLTYKPTQSKMREWQISTFDMIHGAYWQLRREQERTTAQASVQTGIAIGGSSITKNAEVVREEIKRSVVELLIGTRFNGCNATTDPDNEEEPKIPRIDFASNVETMEEIQFIEQAFEWENMSFVFYPYFWADVKKWTELQRIEGTDADFDRFLRSGSARVVLPARPGFECSAELYTLFGTIWGNGPAPMPGDELYLSIAEEVRAQQNAPKDGEPGEWWEVRLPTTLVYLSALSATMPLQNNHAEKLPKR